MQFLNGLQEVDAAPAWSEPTEGRKRKSNSDKKSALLPRARSDRGENESVEQEAEEGCYSLDLTTSLDLEARHEPMDDPSEFLYIERVLVDVAHRGHEVGLRAFDALLDHYRGVATLAFCKPFPMFTDDKYLAAAERRYFDPARVKVPFADAKERLAAYWGRLGFRKLGRGPYYVVNLRDRTSLDVRLPKL